MGEGGGAWVGEGGEEGTRVGEGGGGDLGGGEGEEGTWVWGGEGAWRGLGVGREAGSKYHLFLALFPPEHKH